MSSSTRWLVGIAVALGVLALVAVGAALATRGGQALEYPEDTPEGVVQRYLRALGEGDTATAYGYLAPDVQAACPQREWREQAQWSAQQLEDAQVLLREVQRPAAGEAVVRVEVRRVEIGQPFPVPPNEYSFEERFRLRQQDDGSWRLAEPVWPVPWCRPLPPDKPTEPSPQPS